MHSVDRRAADRAELRLIHNPDYSGIRFLNTTKIHVEAAVDQMLS
jgi:aspartate/glutamate racemase